MVRMMREAVPMYNCRNAIAIPIILILIIIILVSLDFAIISIYFDITRTVIICLKPISLNIIGPQREFFTFYSSRKVDSHVTYDRKDFCIL